MTLLAREIVARHQVEKGRADAAIVPGSRSSVRLGLMLVLAIYAVMIQWVFEVRIAPVFSYIGERYQSPDPSGYAISLILVCVLGWALPQQLNKASDFLLWMIFAMMIVPTVLIPQYAASVTHAQALTLSAVTALSFLLVVALVRAGGRFSYRPDIPPHLVWLTVGMFSVLTYSYMAFTTGLHFQFRSLGDVYDIRFAYRDQIASNGPLLGYLTHSQGDVINPAIMAAGIYKRRWSIVATGVVGQILIFSVTGYKLIFLSAIAVIALAVMFRLSRRPLGLMIPVGLLLTSVAAVVADSVIGAVLYTSVFVDRLILAPGILSAAYLQAFDGHPKALWAGTLLNPISRSPYPDMPDFIVGTAMTGNPKVAANAGYVADGFANYGYVGVFAEALALALLLCVVDAVSRHLPLPVVAVIMLIPVIALTNASPFSSVLSNGWGIAIALMACLPATGWDRLKLQLPTG